MDLLFGLSLVLNILLGYRLFLEWRERRRVESSLRGFRDWSQRFMDEIQAEQHEFIRNYLTYQNRGQDELQGWLSDLIDKID